MCMGPFKIGSSQSVFSPVWSLRRKRTVVTPALASYLPETGTAQQLAIGKPCTNEHVFSEIETCQKWEAEVMLNSHSLTTDDIVILPLYYPNPNPNPKKAKPFAQFNLLFHSSIIG